MRQLVLNIRELVRRPGDSKRITLSCPIEEPIVLGILQIPQDSKLELEILLESVQEGILASGEIRGTAAGQCSRCLDPVSLDLEVDFEELFAYSGVSDEDLLVVNDQIDLNQVVIDSVVLSLPFQPVCSDSCGGLCPECGLKMMEHSMHNHEPVEDARWAPLRELKLKQHKEE